MGSLVVALENMFTAVKLLIVLLGVYSASGIRGVDKLNVLTKGVGKRDSCGDFPWLTCPPNYGLTTYDGVNCCSNTTFCPTDFPVCLPSGGCCPLGSEIDCGSFCCPKEYPVCSADKQCLKGGCACTGCFPDPCQFHSCSQCQSCCSLYIPAICESYTCTGGSVGQLGVFNGTRCG